MEDMGVGVSLPVGVSGSGTSLCWKYLGYEEEDHFPARRSAPITERLREARRGLQSTAAISGGRASMTFLALVEGWMEFCLCP